MLYSISNVEAGYIEQARKAAFFSEHPDYKHAAVLVRGGSIINVSPNKNRYCRFGARFLRKKPTKRRCPHLPTLHAEIGAVLGIDKSVTQGATIYVIRVGKDGNYKMSKPCEMCTAALEFVGIKKVIYSVDGGFEKMRLP